MDLPLLGDLYLTQDGFEVEIGVKFVLLYFLDHSLQLVVDDLLLLHFLADFLEFLIYLGHIGPLLLIGLMHVDELLLALVLSLQELLIGLFLRLHLGQDFFHESLGLLLELVHHVAFYFGLQLVVLPKQFLMVLFDLFLKHFGTIFLEALNALHVGEGSVRGELLLDLGYGLLVEGPEILFEAVVVVFVFPKSDANLAYFLHVGEAVVLDQLVVQFALVLPLDLKKRLYFSIHWVLVDLHVGVLKLILWTDQRMVFLNGLLNALSAVSVAAFGENQRESVPQVELRLADLANWFQRGIHFI